MIQLALPVFFLMLGAALLGFSIAWTMRKIAIDHLRMELVQAKNVSFDIENERQYLVEHANALQSEKEILLRQQSYQVKEKKELAQHLDALANEKMSLEAALRNNSHQTSSVDIVKQNDQQQIAQVEELKTRFQKKYNEKKQKWEEKYRTLHFKLLKVARERDDLLSSSNIMPSAASTEIETSPPERHRTLEKIKKKFKKWQENSEKNQNDIVPAFFPEMMKPEKTPVTRPLDDLQVIRGIGPTTEKKLNALGIYSYQQIARLEEKDILLVNKILDLKPTYILENEWVAQARKLK